MTDQQIDYDALAKQAGAIQTPAPPAAGIDYDALAKQAGSVTPSDDQNFSTSSLGPNFTPDYETTVYAKPLPPDAPPGFWGNIWNHIKGAEMAPFDIAIPGVYRGAAQSSHLLGNAMDLLDKTEALLSDMTGSRRLDWFKNAANWFRNQATGANQTADQFSAGNQSFPAQLGRSVVTGLTQLPTYALATELGGEAAPAMLGEFGPSVMGFGGLGALEQEDKGLVPELTGAAAGAATGGSFHIIGQTGLPLRVPLSSWLGYIQSRLGGADPTTALANGASMGLFSALPGAGGAGVRDIAGNIVSPLADRYLPISPEKSAAAQDVINQGRKYNIPLTAGDISQEPALKNMEVSLEKIPLQGMQKLRVAQNERAKAAAQGIQSQYEQKLLDTDQSSLEELEAAAASGDQRARNVQEKMIEAGNDPDRIIQASIGLGDWTTRQTANNLYDRVQNLAEEHNLGDVPMDATVKAINSSLQQLLPAKLPNKEVIRLLKDVKDSIVPETDEEGNVTKQPDNSYGLIRQLHSDLGDRIREYYDGNNALIGEKGVGYLERTHNALEDDMRNYALNSDVPEIVDAGRQADTYYKAARVPYKNGMLASAAVSNEPDQIWQQFIKAGKGDRAQQFYNALDDKGRAAIRYNMVKHAVEDSINPQSGIFSPQKFFTSVDKLDKAYGVFFKAQDLNEIQGFKNLMGHITRAGQYAENPPTGQRTIPYLIGGALAKAAEVAQAHPVGAAGMAALFGTMRGLFTTTRGRNLLLRAYGIKPGTGPMESTWQDVGKDMPKVSGKPPEKPPEGPPTGPSGEPPQSPPGWRGTEAPAGGTLADSLQKQADAAIQRMRDRGDFTGRMNAGVPVDSMTDMAIWGAAKIAKGVTKFGAWSKEMLNDAGAAADQIKPQLPALWLSAQKTFQDHVAKTAGQLANTKKLMEMYKAGESGKDWYRNTQKELEDIFGPDDARMMVKFLAATSPNTTVPANVAMALKAYSRYRMGQPFEVGEGGFQKLHASLLDKAAAGEPFGGLKAQSFEANLFGDPISVTVDRWIARAMGFGDKVNDAQYKFADYMLTQIAKRQGMEPRQLQAAIWKAVKDQYEAARGKGSTGKPFEELLPAKIAKDPQMQQLIKRAKGGEPGPARPSRPPAPPLTREQLNRQKMLKTYFSRVGPA